MQTTITAPAGPDAAGLAKADLALLRETRPAFADDPDRTAAAFYATLFRQAPGLRPMFPHDMSDQGRKLCAMISAAINAAGDMETLGPILAELARRHVAYGVTVGHYTVVGRALLATLADLGASPAHLAAWERTYAAIASVMIAAAYPPASGPDAGASPAAKL